MEISLRKFLQSMIYAGICVLTVFIAADKLGVSSASIVAILGSAGLALSLSLQNVLSNFAGGVIILLMKPFKVGDYIVCGTEEGTVTSIGLVYTTLGTIDNRQVVLPNGALSNMTLTNATAQEKRRLEIKVGIGYGSDLKKAKEILLEQFRSHPCVRRDEEPAGLCGCAGREFRGGRRPGLGVHRRLYDRQMGTDGADQTSV